jgi:hypothetical protein
MTIRVFVIAEDYPEKLPRFQIAIDDVAFEYVDVHCWHHSLWLRHKQRFLDPLNGEPTQVQQSEYDRAPCYP